MLLLAVLPYSLLPTHEVSSYVKHGRAEFKLFRHNILAKKECIVPIRI